MESVRFYDLINHITKTHLKHKLYTLSHTPPACEMVTSPFNHHTREYYNTNKENDESMK